MHIPRIIIINASIFLYLTLYKENDALNYFNTISLYILGIIYYYDTNLYKWYHLNI